jgi:hypothetical protein
MDNKDSYKMNNPAKKKLIISGLVDLFVALFFITLICFTLFYIICPLFNITTEYTVNFDNNYSIMIARYFGGMSGLVAVLFLIIGLTFLIGLIFSFSYIKSSFSIARMTLKDAKTKNKILTLHGITQIIIGIIAITLALYTIIKLNGIKSAYITAVLDTIVAVLFLTTGSIKLDSAKTIRKTNTPIQGLYSQNYPSYYYYD